MAQKQTSRCDLDHTAARRPDRPAKPIGRRHRLFASKVRKEIQIRRKGIQIPGKGIQSRRKGTQIQIPGISFQIEPFQGLATTPRPRLCSGSRRRPAWAPTVTGQASLDFLRAVRRLLASSFRGPPAFFKASEEWAPFFDRGCFRRVSVRRGRPRSPMSARERNGATGAKVRGPRG